MIRIKRVYDPPAPEDGYRILVDGMWPRGLKKSDLVINEWIREIAPSQELRKWYSHDPGKWPVFREKYFRELDSKESIVNRIRDIARNNNITFVFSSKDSEISNAEALKEYMEKKLKT